MLVATHSGPFHCDDVFAGALLRCFLDPALRFVRTRDLARIAEADIAIDVGGEYDAARGRFDHHQREYTGPLSSAGMVLSWLESEGRVDLALARKLREQWVDYIDAVDNGRRKPDEGVPCLPSVVGALCEQAESSGEFDERYAEAVQLCEGILRGLRQAQLRTELARAAVKEAMDQALRDHTRIMTFDRHLKWKRAYFEFGGAQHPTDYALFPEGDRWQLVAIPPEHDSFDKKRPLPEAWAGLVDEELSKVVGVPDARFCHKNRFIAVFGSRESALAAIAKWGLAQRPE
ncbi:MAG: MYG1 family protein [Myxococcales bacterium]